MEVFAWAIPTYYESLYTNFIIIIHSHVSKQILLQ